MITCCRSTGPRCSPRRRRHPDFPPWAVPGPFWRSTRRLRMPTGTAICPARSGTANLCQGNFSPLRRCKISRRRRRPPLLVSDARLARCGATLMPCCAVTGSQRQRAKKITVACNFCRCASASSLLLWSRLLTSIRGSSQAQVRRREASMRAVLQAVQPVRLHGEQQAPAPGQAAETVRQRERG